MSSFDSETRESSETLNLINRCIPVHEFIFFQCVLSRQPIIFIMNKLDLKKAFRTSETNFIL